MNVHNFGCCSGSRTEVLLSFSLHEQNSGLLACCGGPKGFLGPKLERSQLGHLWSLTLALSCIICVLSRHEYRRNLEWLGKFPASAG